MFFSTFLAAVVLPLLALASPIINPISRAGAPSFTPIPANCTLTNPLQPTSAHVVDGTIVNWAPSAAIMNQTVYSFYLAQPDFESYSTRYEGCLEQCYSLTGCKSVLFANNAPTPAGYYGTAGGVPSLGCIMFGVSLTPADFVLSNTTLWLNETAANINC